MLDLCKLKKTSYFWHVTLCARTIKEQTVSVGIDHKWTSGRSRLNMRSGTADVIQEMHRKSGRRFSVVVNRSCSGLVVQSPRIHYGLEYVYRQDVYLCHNAALYYLSKETKKKEQ